MTARCRRAWSSSIVQRVYSTWGGHSGQVSPIEFRFSDRDGGRLGRKAWWRILASDFERPVCTENSSSGVVVMKSAEDGV
jgi:hypothetical protein